jgi:hypothetical protein
MMNGEKGQALPLAILTLAIGALVIVPFLSHAGSSIIGSRVYGEVIDQQSACDAGIEHAIWSLTRGALAEQFTEPGEEVTYQLGETLNGFNTTVTVTANATSQGGTPGEIENTVIDTLSFDSASGYYPDIIHISGNIYAIAYQGNGADGFIRTVEIDPEGNITNSVIDSLEFDTSDCVYPDIISVSGNVYAVAYQGPGNDGFIKTVSITPGGNIGHSVIDTLEFDTSNGREPVIIHVSGNIFAVAYRGSGNDGFLKTVWITPGGDIGHGFIDTLEYDTSNGYYPDIIHISGSIYAIAYEGPGNDGFLKTVEIAPNGNISNSAIDTLEFDTSDCTYPDIIYISGNIYAIAYEGSNNDGFVKTVAIAPNGNITNSVIDTLEFDTVNGQEPKIINVTGDVYAIAYRDANNDGFLCTITIAAGGQIAASVIDKLEYDTSNGYYPDIIRISEGILAVAYGGPSISGYLKTIGINANAATSASWEIVATAGNSTVRAFVNTDNTTATIVSWQIE